MLQLFNQLQASMNNTNDGIDMDNYMDLENQKKIAENIR